MLQGALAQQVPQEVASSDVHQDFCSGIATPYRATLSEDERTAGLSILWAEAKHHFVYFDRLPNLNWDTQFLEYLPKVRAASTTLEYYRVLQRLWTELADEHTVVRLPNQLAVIAESVPAIQVGRVAGKVVITSVDDPVLLKAGVKAGLQILGVDGIPVGRYAAERVAPFYGDDHRTLHYLLGGPRDTSVSLQLREGNGPDFTRSLPRVRLSTEATAQMESPRFQFKLLAGNIGYVALNTFRDGGIVADFIAAFDSIRRTDALVIDLRNNHGGNSQFSDRILACLTDKGITSEVFEFRGTVPQGNRRELLPHRIEPDGRRLFPKPVALLIGPHTASSAESFVVAFDSLHRGRIIGQRTAGATGQPLTLSLPGGGTGSVLSMRVRYASGKEFMFTGIQPETEVAMKTADLLAGIDTALEAAVRYLMRQIGIRALDWSTSPHEDRDLMMAQRCFL